MEKDLLSEVVEGSDDAELKALAASLGDLNLAPEEMQKKLIEAGLFIPASVKENDQKVQ